MSEKIFLEKRHETGSVFVSDARIILSGRTYSTSNVTSVGADFRKEHILGVHPLVVGIGIAIIAFIFAPGQYAVRMAGLLGALAFVICAKFDKTYYIVRLGSASGENEALQSEDQNSIGEIVDAINQAIIYRSNTK
jgi:hypothetical protein